MELFLVIVIAVVFADLMSGIFHWWEDRYGNPEWPLIGEWIVKPNQLHHIRPALLCEGGYWSRNNTTIIPSITGACLFWWCMPVCLGFILLSQSNEIHSWAHQKCNPFIRAMQRIGILQSPRHHSVHHKRPFDRYYCVMTNYLNPVLNVTRFWSIIEFAVWSVSGILPRPERQVA